jgi:cytosine/adenosine deaminase-related metal-dependent hydrolase
MSFGLAILGPYYSAWDVTRRDVALANEFDLLCSMHVGGGVPMVADGFERLAAEGLIGKNFNVVHGNDIRPEVIRQIIQQGGTFTTTAEIELQMGYGDPLTGRLHALGSPMSIGTDVEPAARGDMFTAMRVTLQHERNRVITAALERTGSRPDKMPLTCRHALEWTTIHGAKVAGLDRRTGSLVMQGGVANVDTVLIAGKVMKRNGRLVFPKLAEKMEALRGSGDRILSDFGYLPRQAA